MSVASVKLDPRCFWHPRNEGTIFQRTKSMTALQDWLSFRPVDPTTIVDAVCRPLRAVLHAQEADARTEQKLLSPGVERC